MSKKREAAKFIEANRKPAAQIPINVLRTLNSYGIKPIWSTEANGYALIDREKKIYAGSNYELQPNAIIDIANDLRAKHPLHLPPYANGLFYPDLYKKCRQTFQWTKKRMGDKICVEDCVHDFKRRYPDEFKQYEAEWNRTCTKGMLYQRKFKSLPAIVRMIFGWMLKRSEVNA